MTQLKRILLAEDDTRDVELTLAALEHCHLADHVIVARDGEEALDYLHGRRAYQGRGEDNPAVLLLDLKMPKVDGIEVLRQVRANEKLRTIPVVMLTSSGERRDVMTSYELGANAYVIKPIDFGRFVEVLQQIGVFWASINQPPPPGLGPTAASLDAES
ncbi:MAG: response regulator [Verrucomicrobia bacterium]|nr:response regulator [Verrucomicrobiota bacterium]